MEIVKIYQTKWYGYEWNVAEINGAITDIISETQNCFGAKFSRKLLKIVDSIKKNTEKQLKNTEIISVIIKNLWKLLLKF